VKEQKKGGCGKRLLFFCSIPVDKKNEKKDVDRHDVFV